MRSAATTLAPPRSGILAVLGALALAGPAQAGFIDFGGFDHGRIIDDEYLASDGLTISADDPVRSFEFAVIFDSGRTETRDDDLEGPGGRPWAAGNVSEDEVFGNLLIVQENSIGCDDDECDRPDDEAPPGGDLIFSFDRRIASFGFDIVDMESGQAVGAAVLFFDGAGPAIASVPFGSFECAVGPFCDPTVDFAGDNSANHLSEVTAAALGVAGFDRVVIDLNGSGAVDNVRYGELGGPSVPEPALAWLLAPMLLALALPARG